MPDRSDQPADKGRTRRQGDAAVLIMRGLVDIQSLVRREGWDHDAAQLGALAAAVDAALGLAEQWAEVKARHEGVVCRIGERCPVRRAQLRKGGQR